MWAWFALGSDHVDDPLGLIVAIVALRGLRIRGITNDSRKAAL